MVAWNGTIWHDILKKVCCWLSGNVLPRNYGIWQYVHGFFSRLSRASPYHEVLKSDTLFRNFSLSKGLIPPSHDETWHSCCVFSVLVKGHALPLNGMIWHSWSLFSVLVKEPRATGKWWDKHIDGFLLICLGATPYHEMDSLRVAKTIRKGIRLEHPPHCRQEL